MIDIKQLMEAGGQAALAAGKAIMEIYDSGDFQATLKVDASPITRADEKAHRVIVEMLLGSKLPILSEEGGTIPFRERKNWKYFWLVDPLDGTKEFLQKNGEFTINIALMARTLPVAGIIYAPCSDILYTGSRETGIFRAENNRKAPILPRHSPVSLDELVEMDMVRVAASRSHFNAETKAFMDRFKNIAVTSMGSSLKFMLLLEDKADIYPRFGTTMEWDTAAAHAILNAGNRGVYQMNLQSELTYNKPDLKNPFFIAF